MSEIPLQQALDVGLAHHTAGRLAEAERVYRQILAAQPEYAPAMHLLGAVAHQVGKSRAAVELIGRAIAIDPNVPAYWCNYAIALGALHQHQEAADACREAIKRQSDYATAHMVLGNALNHLGRLDESIASLQRAVNLQPGSAEAHANLANPLINSGRYGQAAATCRRAIAIRQNMPEAWSNLGTALHGLGELREALNAYREALRQKPNLIDALNNMGNVLTKLRDFDGAIDAYRRAMAIEPNNGGIYTNLAAALIDAGRFNAAVAAARKAVELSPDYPNAHFVLGHVQSLREQLDEALAEFRRAIELRDDYAQARSNIGAVYHNMGRQDEAIAAHRDMLARSPGEIVARTNLIYTMLFHPASSPMDARHEMELWDELHAGPLLPESSGASDSTTAHGDVPRANPERRLRIGYISTDFRDHVIGRNILPILQQHDHDRFEIFCYSAVTCPDARTEAFKKTADVWRDIEAIDDAELAEMIRRDRIDVLLDLSLHLSGNRLLVFARKPAPVQVSWAGYPGGTGVRAIDYRLSDPHLDPPENDAFYLQETYRLPDSFWCYDPIDLCTPVTPLPALKTGHVTFGCLNNFCKVTPAMLRLWARVMGSSAAGSNSRMLMLVPEGSCQDRVRELFAAEGVAAERLSFCVRKPRGEFVKYYQEIDIGLDTFPYNGHTTSIEGLWMGVPTVTLCGQSAVSRAGLSQLTNLGLTDLVAANEDEFMRIAADLARDLPRLANLRATLRAKMEHSPLMDARRFARNLEEAYRRTWRQWCAGKRDRLQGRHWSPLP